VARNRKRAKERRARRPQGASVAASARLDRDAAPDPIEHASPDVDLAEAQLALGRPELSANPEDAAADEAEFELEAGQEPAGDAEEDSAGTPSSKVVAGRRPHAASRLATFVQGSWRELQRVQWPDRRQVMQATGVVIGFVIVAGAFLGIADLLAGKVMNYILTGNFK